MNIFFNNKKQSLFLNNQKWKINLTVDSSGGSDPLPKPSKDFSFLCPYKELPAKMYVCGDNIRISNGSIAFVSMQNMAQSESAGIFKLSTNLIIKNNNQQNFQFVFCDDAVYGTTTVNYPANMFWPYEVLERTSDGVTVSLAHKVVTDNFLNIDGPKCDWIIQDKCSAIKIDVLQMKAYFTLD